ncbi:MAG: hypothetical protein ACXABY_09435 [Candidatus Thorarchaeota archaeon]
MLVNFQNVGEFIATDDYVAYLASQRLGAYIPGDTLDIHVFDALAMSEVVWGKILSLEPEIAAGVIRDVQKDRETRSLFDKMSEASLEEKLQIESTIVDKTTEFEKKHMNQAVEEAEKETVRLRTGVAELSAELNELKSARQKDIESIKNISEKLESTQKQLQDFETMSLWARLRHLFSR